MTHEALIKIDKLIEESENKPTLFDLSTNAKRVLAAKIHDLTEAERDKLGLISKRLKIGLKNGAIDSVFTAAIFGLAAAATAAAGSAPVAAITAALGTAAAVGAGANAWKKSRENAFIANDMNATMGKKEIDKLVGQLEGLIGKPLVKLIKLDGKIRLS